MEAVYLCSWSLADTYQALISPIVARRWESRTPVIEVSGCPQGIGNESFAKNEWATAQGRSAPLARGTLTGADRSALGAFGHLQGVLTMDEIIADHPELEREDIVACLHYARLLLSGEPVRHVA